MVKWIGVIVGAVLVVAIGLFAAMMIASETGGEVVVLRTLDAQGQAHETSLWVVEDEGAWWLRAGQPSSGWLQRLQADPEVELQRAGEWHAFTAVVVPGRGARVNELMARDYPAADALISLMRDPAGVTAVRLDPREDAAR